MAVAAYTGHGTSYAYQRGCRCSDCREAATRARYESRHRQDPVEREPGVVIAARVRDLFARADRERMAWLTRVIRKGGTCRFCRAQVSDRVMVKHPGICATCWKRGRRGRRFVA